MNNVLSIKLMTSSEQETIQIGRVIGSHLDPGDVILITGDLGTGKTRLVKGIINEALGIDLDEIVSPSFTLINTYQGKLTISHADLYRIENSRIEAIGISELAEEGDALIVEWAESIHGDFGDPLKISILYGDKDEDRTFCLQWTKNGKWDRAELARVLGQFAG